MCPRLGFLCGVAASCWLGLLQSCSPEYALLSSDDPAPDVEGRAGSGLAIPVGGFSPATGGFSSGDGASGGAEPLATGGENTVGGEDAAGGAAP